MVRRLRIPRRPPVAQRAFLRNAVTGDPRSAPAQKDMIGDYLVADRRLPGILLRKGDEQVKLSRT